MPTQSVYAVETRYARILSNNVGFYKDSERTNLVFYLPYSYYVKVLEQTDTFSHVECYGVNSSTTCIDGYVNTDELFFDGNTPINPYLDLSVTVKKETAIYTDAFLSDKIQNVFSGRTLNYYGFTTDTNGNYLYFVEYGDKLGYVRESDVETFSLSNHPYPIPEPPKEETPDDSTTDNQNTNKKGFTFNFQTIIIVCLCFATIVILLIIFKPTSKKVAVSYYDENDYE